MRLTTILLLAALEGRMLVLLLDLIRDLEQMSARDALPRFLVDIRPVVAKAAAAADAALRRH